MNTKGSAKPLRDDEELAKKLDEGERLGRKGSVKNPY